MKRLFVCNNPYQIIVAILISNQVQKKGDYKEIILTDNFIGAEAVQENLKKNKYFDSVYLSSINTILFPKTYIDKLKKFYSVFFPGKFVKRYIGKAFSLNEYDEVYYNNDDLFLYNIVSFCLKKNKNIKVYRFEEGYSSYIRPFCSLRAQNIFDRRHRNFKFKNILSGMYYFYPNLVLFKAPTLFFEINKNMNDTVYGAVKGAFPVSDISDNLNGKWIIFEESFFQDLGYNEDFKLYQEVINKIGSENIVMKMHPRSKINRFKDYGIKILECGGIPWEAMLILNNFENVKFITLASGSVINSRLMLNDSTESFLLYKCVENAVPSLNTDFEQFVEQFRKKYPKGLHIPKCKEEFYTYIEE